MERNEIDIKETWDLSLIYKDEKAFYEDLEKAKALLKTLSAQKESFTQDADTFLKFNQDDVLLSRYVSKLYNYAHLHCDVEPENQDYQLLLASVMAFYEDVQKDMDWVSLSLIAHEKEVSSYMALPAFSVYRFNLEEALREKDHLLSQEMETLLSKVSGISDLSSSVFDALRLEYEDVDIDGEKKTLNSATLSEFLKNKDPEVRKQAYHHFFKEYKKYENVYATTLSGVMKKDAFYADVRKFKDPLAAAQWNDEVPEDLFYKILDKANKQYRPLFHRYNVLKKKVLGLKEMYNYDLNVPLVEGVEKKYTIDQCFEIIEDVVKVFGDDYVNIIKQARQERWIDFHPTRGKRIGAYSSGCYDTRPYILMNFIGDYNSLSTMIHELGHSCHTYLSSKNQDPANSDYRIFVAEVASTVNETLLINAMLEHAKDEHEKAYFLYEFLENCVGLIFRQPMYAEFEDTLHHWAKDNVPMNASKITELYDTLNNDYYGDAVINDELVGHSCFYIPHFYYDYYVYKYTLGMTVALAIVSRILKGDQQQVKDYLAFLSSGGSMTPLDLLKKAGVNPLEDSLYDDAFHYFEELLNQFEALM